MKKFSMLLVLCAAILPLGAIETYSANQVENVSAPHGFSVAQNETLTVDLIKEKAGTSGEVLVNAEALAAINATSSDGSITNLPIAINGTNHNIVVAKQGRNVVANDSAAIFATDIVTDNTFKAQDAIKLAKVEAYDLSNGSLLNNQVSVVDNGNTITFGLKGVSKQVNVEKKEATNTPQQPTQPDNNNGNTDNSQPEGEGSQKPEVTPNESKISVNDLKITPEIGKKITDPSQFIGMMGAVGTNVDGSTFPVTVEVAPNDLKAIQAGTEGNYRITFNGVDSDNQPVSASAMLTIKPFSLEGQQGQVAFVSANNTLLTSTGVGQKIKTVEDLVKVMEVKATVNGEVVAPTITVDKQDDILAGTPGTYNVTFEIKNDDPLKAAKTTVILTIVNDNAQISPDGKGYIEATNFLITTEEAKKIKSTKEYLLIHGVQGTYDGQQALIDVQVPENPKVVAGYQGIYDVIFSLDGDRNPETKEDQVKITKRLTVVMDTQGKWPGSIPQGWVDLPNKMPGAPDYASNGKMGTFFKYSDYTKEQRIQGRFIIAVVPNTLADYSTVLYTVEDFLKLSYEDFIARNARVIIGENGQYITNFDLKNSVYGQNGNKEFVGPDGATLEQIMTGGSAAGGYMYNYGLDAKSFPKIQAYVKERYENEYQGKDCQVTNNPIYTIIWGGTNISDFKLEVNGENWLEGLDPFTTQIAGMLWTQIQVYNPDCPLWGYDTDDSKTPPTADMIGQLTTPTNQPPAFSGNKETVVMHNNVVDTSVDNLSALTNTKVLDNNQVVKPESVTLNPTTIPEYGTVEATFTYKDLTTTTTLHVYPDNAIINNDQTGYVAGNSTMVTQNQLVSIKDEAAFLNLIKASSATNTKDFANPIIECDNIADLQAGKVGVYNITLSNADKSASTKIVFTVRPNSSKPTPDNKGYVTAVGSFITQDQAKQLQDPTQLASSNNVSSVYNGQAVVAKVNVDPNSFAKIQNGDKGVYPITYTIDGDGDPNTTDDFATVTVNLAVAPEGSQLSGDGLGFIYAQDATIYSSQAQALTDPSELVPLMNAFAFYGENEQMPQVVDTDFRAIQTSRGGQYQVTFLLDGTNNPLTRARELQMNQAAITVTLTVIDDIQDPAPQQPTPVVAEQPAPQIPTGVKNAAIGLIIVVVVAAAALVVIKRKRK